MKSPKEYYQQNFLTCELVISLFVSLLAIYTIQSHWSQTDASNWITSNKSQLYSLLANVSGTLLGFIITGISIILAFAESQKLKLLRESTQYKTIFMVYFSAIKYLALTTIMTILGLVIDNSTVEIYLLYLIIWLVVISSLRIWRCLWILKEIVKIMTSKVKG